MGVDLLSLTTLLFLSGGPANPFTIFFFVNLALAAGGAADAIELVVAAARARLPRISACRPLARSRIESARRCGRTQHLTLQQVGLVTAVALCAGVAIYFITRVTRELQERETELRRAELQTARSERLEAFGRPWPPEPGMNSPHRCRPLP